MSVPSSRRPVVPASQFLFPAISQPMLRKKRLFVMCAVDAMSSARSAADSRSQTARSGMHPSSNRYGASTPGSI